MNDSYDSFDELEEYLKAQGHSSKDIRKIFNKLDEYDKMTVHDSVFDSLEKGTFTLKAIIQEAIEDDSSKKDSDSPGEDPKSASENSDS